MAFSFLLAAQALWAARCEGERPPLAPQEADYLHRLLLVAAEQDTSTPVLQLKDFDALQLSERSLRRIRQGLLEGGWLRLDGSQPLMSWLAPEELPAIIPFVQEIVPVEAPAPAAMTLAITPAPAVPIAPKRRPSRPVAVAPDGYAYAEHTSANERLDMQDVRTWLEQEAPSVLRIKDQLTCAQLTTLYRKFEAPLLAHILRQLHNKANKRYTSVYLTVQNWCLMEQARNNGGLIARAHAVDPNPLPQTLRVLEQERVASATLFTPQALTQDPRKAAAERQAQERERLFWSTPETVSPAVSPTPNQSA